MLDQQSTLLVVLVGKQYTKNVYFECQFIVFSQKIQLNLQLSNEKNRFYHRILITLHQIIINYINKANLNRIKVVLVEKGKTGKWLAEEIGKTPCTVSKWCSNSIQPDLTTLDKIARLLNVDVKDLLNSTEQIDNIH